MNKRFETLFALEPNLYAEGSPVMVSAGVLLRDADSNRLVAQLKFRNVSPKTIWALTISLSCVDTGNNPTGEVLSYQYQDLTAARGEEFGSNKAILLPNNTRGYAVTSVKAVFSDGTTAGCDRTFTPMPPVEALSAALPDEEAVKQYCLATNEKAAYAPVDAMGLHLCPCGSWHTAPFCGECGQSHEAAMAAYHLPTLIADRDARLVREEADREEARCAEAYQKAFKTMDTAKLPLQLQKAEKEFDALGDYQNSRDMADTCRRMLKEMALQKAEAPKNVYDLKEAEKIFLHLGDMDDCPALAEQCHARAEKGMEKLKAKTKRTAKRICIAAVIVAIVIAMIPISINYIIPAAKYAQAEKALEAANYDKAIAVFTQLGEYKDADVRIQEATYGKADALLDAGSYEEATALFSSLGQYEDSKTRVKECSYLWGKDLMAQNSHAEAYELLKTVKSYEDAAAQMDICCVALAKTAYSEAEYEEAVAWYQKMNTVDKTDETYLDSLYRAAMEALEAQQYQKAVDLLQKAGNYSDSPDKRREAMYAYVTANLTNTNKTTHLYLNRLASMNYADSAALFENLYSWKITVTATTSSTNPENMDSIAKNRKFYFHVAVTGGQPDETITIFSALKRPDGKTDTHETQTLKNGDTFIVQCPALYKTGTATLTISKSGTDTVLIDHSVRLK